MPVTREPVQLPESSQHRILSYIAGATALLASAGTAEAGIVYNSHGGIRLGTGDSPWVLDIDGDGNDDLDFASLGCGCYYSAVGGGWASTNLLYAGVTYGPVVNPSLIGPTNDWVPGDAFLVAYPYPTGYDPGTGYPTGYAYSEVYGSWIGLNGAPSFLGVQFEREDALGVVQTHYGWIKMRVGVHPDTGAFMEIFGSAWETQANTEISTASTPEPGSLGLLAGGILGLAAWRKRKAAVAE